MNVEEWIVVGTVIVGLFAFEALPKVLNIIRNRRQSKELKKSS